MKHIFRRKRNPFDRGCLSNFLHILCGPYYAPYLLPSDGMMQARMRRLHFLDGSSEEDSHVQSQLLGQNQMVFDLEFGLIDDDDDDDDDDDELTEDQRRLLKTLERVS